MPGQPPQAATGEHPDSGCQQDLLSRRDFTPVAHLTAFIIGFALLAAVGVIALLTTATMFLSENHTVRVRRHEGVFGSYGHLAMGR